MVCFVCNEHWASDNQLIVFGQLFDPVQFPLQFRRRLPDRSGSGGRHQFLPPDVQVWNVHGASTLGTVQPCRPSSGSCVLAPANFRLSTTRVVPLLMYTCTRRSGTGELLDSVRRRGTGGGGAGQVMWHHKCGVASTHLRSRIFGCRSPPLYIGSGWEDTTPVCFCPKTLTLVTARHTH